ncbi:MAG TPA: CHAD domain-containing protein [Tepidisphaeraceae bacterium]|nr:CHAD domain-containing protein [Tepidisphaeraceae bacterium]
MSKTCTLAGSWAIEAIRTQQKAMKEQLDPLHRDDADAIHDMRVASRRLRAILSENRKFLNKKLVRQVNEDARTVTRALGKARELDVSIETLAKLREKAQDGAQAAADHVTQYLRGLRAAAAPDVVTAVNTVESPGFDEGVQALCMDGLQKRTCYFRHAAKSTFKLFSRVVEAHYDWQTEKSDEKLHRLRIAFKKFRYACEIYRDLYGSGMKGLINDLKDLQEALGDWHDYLVLRMYAEEAAPSAPGQAVEGFQPLLQAINKKARKHLETFEAVAGSFFAQEKQEATFAFLVGDPCPGKRIEKH